MIIDVTKEDLLLNPEDWSLFNKSDYRRMYERSKAEGIHVFMHLCLNIPAILLDLVGIRLELLNPVQHLIDILFVNGGDYFGGTTYSVMPETLLDGIIALYEAFLEAQGKLLRNTLNTEILSSKYYPTGMKG